ncbi:MAG: hypothetical protein ABSA59_10235 [Terriglobia bacterium]|jgi:hypothetical protein
MARTSDLEGQRLAEIADYHNDAVDSLTFFLQPLLQQNNPRFINYSSAEFNELLHSRIEETGLRSSLATLAAVEAALRNDYRLRVTQRHKDPLSRAFRVIYKTKREKVRLDENLLDLWVRHHPELRRLVGELRAALHFRHWLAHGRYGERPAHGRFDYDSIYNLADLILSNFFPQ